MLFTGGGDEFGAEKKARLCGGGAAGEEVKGLSSAGMREERLL